ncbi:MAG: hypothetical protein M3445_04710 [Actinomycetota bacterium]|nr:hypothetical protein [Actinomycetota bacterium]
MVGLGAPELLILLVFPVVFVLPLWGSSTLHPYLPDPQWAAVGQSKIVWVLVQVFLWTIKAAVYFLAIRPQLKRAAGW